MARPTVARLTDRRRLRPTRHLRNDRTATVVIAGHAFVQNLRRGHYHLTTGVPAGLRLVAHSTNSPMRSDRGALPEASPRRPIH